MPNLNKDKNVIKEIAPFLTIGIEMMLYILIFTFLGYWLDEKLNTSPLLTIILALFGIFASFYKFFKSVLKLNNNKNKKT